MSKLVQVVMYSYYLDLDTLKCTGSKCLQHFRA